MRGGSPSVLVLESEGWTCDGYERDWAWSLTIDGRLCAIGVSCRQCELIEHSSASLEGAVGTEFRQIICIRDTQPDTSKPDSMLIVTDKSLLVWWLKVQPVTFSSWHREVWRLRTPI